MDGFDVYPRVAFEVQRGLGVGWTMQALNEDAIKKVLSRPWTVDNQTFTARCWTDKVKLVETVNQEITQMMARGTAPDKAIEAIAKRFNTSKSNAGRVVMTESAYFSSAAQKDCFNELDVEQYRIVGTLDTHTCDICGDLDGHIYKMGDYVVGSTAPPFHPWCRCCTAPYFADMDGIGERYARDVVTGERYKLPKDTTYKQWKEMQDAAYGSGTVDKMRRMGYNESADKAQFEKYRAVLGEEAPTSYDDFVKIKYEDKAGWEKLKYQYRTVNRYEVDGNVRASKIIELDNAAWYTKQTSFDPKGFTGRERKIIKNLARAGNAATMELDGKMYFSHSAFGEKGSFAIGAYKGEIEPISLLPNRRFSVMDLGDDILREYDTEAKFLEYTATVKNATDKFEVTILSERHICESCQGVVVQFKQAFPNATVNIVSGKLNYNGSTTGNKTWKYRKKVKQNVK